MDLNAIRAARRRHVESLLKKINVVGVGVGWRIRDGKQTEEQCIVVSVTRKVPLASLWPAEVVPSVLDGVRVDVVETKAFTAWGFDPKLKHRPAMPGISIGHHNITAGTLGCVVQDTYGNRRILSNNHVLANSNAGVGGDALLQPGAADGGTSEDQVGVLGRFVPLTFTGGIVEPPGNGSCAMARGVAAVANLAAALLKKKHRLRAYNAAPEAELNKVDAALGIPGGEVLLEIAEIGAPAGVAVGELGTPVQKYGRTTEYTSGEIEQIDATVMVSYGGARMARFDDQMIAGAMSAGGDSGSAVLDMNRNVVGLLFAGSEKTTVINRIENVLAALDVRIALPGSALVRWVEERSRAAAGVD